MINLSRLAVAAAVAASVIASPALAQSFDPEAGTGNVLPSSFAATALTSRVAGAAHNGHRNVAAHRRGIDAFAMAPGARTGSSNDPALTGGGSLGYNQMLLQY